ncbi:choice-of-anchor J domain-containing protein [Flavobacterium sp. 3HN19-14]|uniref:T9SS type A sorting domain-containing protein n=1 Tax=Flavobacterium sp. 3HN19-14 TaxID=3448133 RepID=UPI003EDF63BB
MATDYITITNETGSQLLAAGTTPISWYSGGYSGIIRYHINKDANCTAEDVSRSKYIKCTFSPCPNITPIFTQVAAVCPNSVIAPLPVDSNNGINGSWSPALNNTATTTYTFTPAAGQCALTTTMTITVNPANIVPTFTQVAAICSGSTLNALPVDSNNGIHGTWSPALNNTATTTYTFTPAAGQCATTKTMTITVNPPNIVPTFTQVAAICSGAALASLPVDSNNGIHGVWSPALNNTATTTYTFTPSAGQCATTKTMTITVNPANVVPTFTQVAAICSGAALASLPVDSNNGIHGSWSPALNNTATTTYTFTPSAGQCAIATTMTITVNPANVVPTFTQAAAICSGSALTTLPVDSNNGIHGVWSPALNNTATTTYTFTPSAGQCAIATTMTITVNPANVVPAFTQVAAICSGSVLPSLPVDSNNGIHGVWSPALNNTTTTTYTFTPSAGQCAIATTMTITVNPANVVPAFTQVAAICSGSVLPSLPVDSNNGIHGVWSPALNNTTTTTYTFTPSAGQCAISTTMTITVNPANIVPTFTQVAAICSGASLASLPVDSNNGIHGVWSPALNNTATTTYTFTPSAGQCAVATTMTITVNPANIVPTFTQVAAICSGASLASLPVDSNNGIHGVWSPALNNTATTTYTFTPSAGQCAIATTMTITVNPANVVPTFTQVAAICSGSVLPSLPVDSNNGIHGSWSPALNNTATTTYTFTPSAGQCAIATTMTITVNPANIVPTFTQVAAICSGAALNALPTTSNNGITGTWSPSLNNTATTTYTFTAGVSLFNEGFNTGFGAWSTYSVTGAETWTYGATFGNPGGMAKISGYNAGNQNNEDWLISPAQNLTSVTGLTTLSFDTAYKFNGNPIVALISKDYNGTGNPATAGTWTVLTGATLSSGDYVFANSGGIDISNFTGTGAEHVYIAFKYTSTTTASSTWEIDNVKISNTNQCAIATTMTIAVNSGNVTPKFTQVAPICSGSSLSALPVDSNNGIHGSWSPALNNTATTTYTFTPSAGQCAIATTMTITVNPANVVPTFTQVAAICSGAALASLPVDSNNGIHGVWSPALNNTATTTYTFTPSAGQCAIATTMTITVNEIPSVPLFQDVLSCSDYILPELANANYYTESNGNGNLIPANTEISESQTIYVYTANGACTAESSFTITIQPVDSNITVDNADITASQSDAVYQWYACGDNPIAIDGAISQTFTATENGWYQVEITTPACTIFTDCVQVTSLGIDETGFSNMLLIYPNPSRGLFVVETGNITADKITVVDNLGRTIGSAVPSSNKTSLDIEGFAEGIYYVKISHDGVETTKKLILKL